MTVYPLFLKSSLDEEHIAIMSHVLEELSREFGLAKTEDGLRNIVAEAILCCVQRGLRDPEEIRRCAHGIIKSGRG